MSGVGIQFDAYERIPGLTVRVELVLFCIDEGQLKVLMVERGERPFKGTFVLPGSFMKEDQSLADTALVLRNDLGLPDAKLDEFGLFSSPERDPRGRGVASAYVAGLEPGRLEAVVQSFEGFSLIDIDPGPGGDLVLSWGAAQIGVGFDHDQIVAAAVRHLRRAGEKSLTAFRFLPHYFTLFDLQQVHETIFGQALNKPLFRKQVLGRIFEDGSSLTPSPYKRQGRGAPAMLYERARPRDERLSPG